MWVSEEWPNWMLVVVVCIVLLALGGIRLYLKQSRWGYDHVRLAILDFLDSILMALALVFFIIRPFVVHAFYIPSPSMEPSLQKKDRILVNKFVFYFRQPRRQEIVVFEAPEEAKRASGYDERKEKKFIKRVIGLPGDYVRVSGGSVLVATPPYKKAMTLKEPYVAEPDYRDFPQELSYMSQWREEQAHTLVRWRGMLWVKVPPNCYFVMGDNRGNSLDSRVWGFLRRELLEGKALLRWWPLLRFGMLQ